MPYTFKFERGIERPSRTRHLRARQLILLLRSSEHLWPLALVAAVCCVANAPSLLRIVSTDPVQLFSGLAPRAPHSVLPGSPTIDPSAGTITLSLGHAAQRSWLSGDAPWWNPLEGLGAPLAGEMQSASFFPPVLLMSGWLGFVVFHLVLEAIAGWSTYFLLRGLKISRGTSTALGLAFALCGTFAWLQAPPANPVAFLPLCLLGVEHCFDATRGGRRGGWTMLALGLWLSISSGFAPTAYLDGLLVALWALVRLVELRRCGLKMLAKLGTGTLVGALLSLPVLVAFLDYLPAGALGLNASIGNKELPIQALSQVLVPYVHGPIFAFHSARGYDVMGDIWGNVGGYVDASLFGLALLSLAGRRLRALRVALALWVAVIGAKTFGVPVVSRLVSSFPGLIHVATFRYAAPTWEMALVVLAALAADDVRRKAVPPLFLVTCMAVALGLVAWSLQSAWVMDGSLTGAGDPRSYSLGSAAWSAVVVLVVCAGGLLALRPGEGPSTSRSRTNSIGIHLLNATVALQALGLFMFPLLSASRPVDLDLGPVEFLQAHLGLYRFATLGPLNPNFGSYFGLAELNDNDVPLPRAFAQHVVSDLDTNLDFSVLGQQFTGNEEASTDRPGPGAQLARNLHNYELDGVRYVVVPSSGTDITGTPWPPPGLDPAPSLVYRDRLVEIYELRGASALFTAPDCHLRATDWTDARAVCQHPSTLVYHELPMSGWTATVNGRSQLPRSDGVAQLLELPRGTSTIKLGFEPPYVELSLLGVLLGLGILSLSVGLHRRRTDLQESRRYG